MADAVTVAELSQDLSGRRRVQNQKPSYIERKIAARITQADVNNDGRLDQQELRSLVKDLIYEDRSNKRLMLAMAMSSILLVLSLGANFGLLIWAQELSKESHVSATVDAPSLATTSGVGRRMQLYDPSFAAFAKRLEEIRGAPSAITSRDRKSIVETQEAVKMLPLFVTPNLDAQSDASSTPVQPPASRIKAITFDVYDYQQEANKGAAKPCLRTKTMAVEEVEKLSPTHVKFKGKDGECVEVKDGKAIATSPNAGLDAILNSPAFAGSKLEPRIRNLASVGRTKRPDGSAAPQPRSYSTADVSKLSAPLTQPVCGSPMAIVSSPSADSLKELEALEQEAVSRLERRGIDVKDKLSAIKTRQEQLARAPPGGRPLTAADFAEMATPPASFGDACSDPVKTVLVPAVQSIAEAHRNVNRDAERASCDRASNPACFACTDSTLGCVPIELQHNGRLADQMRQTASGSLGAPTALSPPPTTVAPTTSTLFVTEPIGRTGSGAESDTTEVFMADEGICGVKAKGDQTKAIKAIAFRGCASKAFGGFMGVGARAIELKAKQTEASAGQTIPENAFGFQPAAIGTAGGSGATTGGSGTTTGGSGTTTGGSGTTAGGSGATTGTSAFSALSAPNQPTGLEALGFDWTDDGNEAFNGFSAKEGNGIGALAFTRDANFTRNATESSAADLAGASIGGPQLSEYVPRSFSVGTPIGEGGGSDFPPPRPSANVAIAAAADEEAKPVATLGTRAVGAVVRSDGGGAKSVSLIFKDDCYQFIEELDKYAECQARVKNAQTSAPVDQFPTDEFITEMANAVAPAAAAAITPTYQAVIFPSPSSPPSPPWPPPPPPPPPVPSPELPPPLPSLPRLVISSTEQQISVEGSGSLSPGTVAGIVVGSVAGLVLIIAAVYWLYRLKHRGTASPVTGTNSTPLPEGWKEMNDVASGSVYYYNTSNGSTSWVRPTGEQV